MTDVGIIRRRRVISPSETYFSPTGVFITLSGTMTDGTAGAVVGAIMVTTYPPSGSYSGPITLGGPDAGLFALTNNGYMPTNLIVGPTNISNGAYSITLSAN
jgi:hypothetical protein